MNSILYVFLPCKKVYPIGVTYLADFIHRRKPDVRQRILDLSLFPDAQRSSAVRDAATERAQRQVAAVEVRHAPQRRDERVAELAAEDLVVGPGHATRT